MTYLHLNVVGLKHLGLLDESHNEDGVAIGNISDIYQHEDTLDRVLAFYEKSTAANAS